MVWVIGSFEISRVREIVGEIIELERGKFKGNKNWFEISGGSRNRGFEKSGFHCNNDYVVLRNNYPSPPLGRSLEISRGRGFNNNDNNVLFSSY